MDRKKIREAPPVLWGAVLLAVLSLLWSAYAITGLMDSGPFGGTVAVAGDIGWITVLWAEYQGVRVHGRRWPVTAAGWLIALGVAALLVIHGWQAGGLAQAVAGPFVVIVGKTVWTFVLAALADPAALTADQEEKIATLIRDADFEARKAVTDRERKDREADEKIAVIRAEARTVLARDTADFEITLARLDKRAEIDRRTPLMLAPANMIANTAEHDREQIAITANTIASTGDHNTMTRANTDREHPNMADVVRQMIANTPNNSEAVANVLAIIPGANPQSVGAAVRRERRKAGPYL